MLARLALFLEREAGYHSVSLLLLAYLILAAQYNSWLLPLAVLLIVPMCLLSAIIGVWLVDGAMRPQIAHDLVIFGTGVLARSMGARRKEDITPQ